MSARVALATCAAVSPSARDDDALAEALRARGAEARFVPWQDAQVDWSEFSHVLLRSTWDYHLKSEAFATWIDEVAAKTRLINPAPVVHWNRDKSYLRALESRGVPVVPTTWIDPELPAAAFDDALRKLEVERAFLKPVVGANADGTLRFETDEAGRAEAFTHFRRYAGGRPMMLQPYLQSVESWGEVSTIHFDGVFSHAVRKLPRAGDYRVQDDHGASDAAHRAEQAELALAVQALRAVPWPTTVARVDMMRGPHGELWIGELELIEPSLFFRHDASAADRLADAVLAPRDDARD